MDMLGFKKEMLGCASKLGWEVITRLRWLYRDFRWKWYSSTP